MKSTRMWRYTATALTLGAAVAVASSTVNAQPQPFRLIVTELEAPLVPNSVMILAYEMGLFEAAGLNVELVQVTDTPLAVAALQAGEGDMANVALDAALQLVATGADIRAVASPDKFLPFLIACQDSITEVGQLAGATFAVAAVGSLDYTLSSMVMNSYGVSPDTVQFVPTAGGPAGRGTALLAGQVQCTTMSIGIWLSMENHNGVHILVPVGEYGARAPVVNKVNVVTSETLAARGEEVEAVLRVLIELARSFNANPQAWVDAMQVARPDQNVDNLTTLANQFQGGWSVNGGINADELNFAVEQIFRGEAFVGRTAPALADWVDGTAVCAILADIGIDAAIDGGPGGMENVGGGMCGM